MIENMKEAAKAKRDLNNLLQLKKRVSRLGADYSLGVSDLITVTDVRVEELTASLEIYENRILARQDSFQSIGIDLIIELPESLIEMRRSLGWSQSEFGRRVGMAPYAVQRYEKAHYAHIRLSRAIEIAIIMQKSLQNREGCEPELPVAI